jgi:hypothetical protein
MLDLPEQHTSIQPSFPVGEVFKEVQRNHHLTAALEEIDQEEMDSADALEGSNNE